MDALDNVGETCASPFRHRFQDGGQISQRSPHLRAWTMALRVEERLKGRQGLLSESASWYRGGCGKK
jgi:hypothetical protein